MFLKSYSFFSFLQVNEILPEEKCSLIPKTMCHPVNPEDENSAVSLRKKRETDNSNPLSMLRRFVLFAETVCMVFDLFLLQGQRQGFHMMGAKYFLFG